MDEQISYGYDPANRGDDEDRQQGGTTVTTADWLTEAQERANAATPGPWAVLWDERIVTDWRGEADDLGELPSGGYVLGHYIADVGGEDDERSDNEDGDAEPHLDAAFIAHARTDLPRALAALRAVLAICDEGEQRIRASTPPVTAERLIAEGEAATVTVRFLRQAIDAALAG